jgi:two-component system response regulator GlrR
MSILHPSFHALCDTDPAVDACVRANFIGKSAAFNGVVELIHSFSRSKAPVLIIGESGTGKELAAHAVHYLSERRDNAFIPVNCGALPDTLIESELFGHAKGAFTDASRARAGLVRDAERGTLFLDEIESLSPRAQVVLLRFLQDSSFRTIGEEQHRRADVRVITASNVSLRELVERGEFRSDLLFRLDVLSIKIPPLRERLDDFELLAAHLLAKAARSESGKLKTLSPAALDLLVGYAWPGNVRELEHVLLRAHLLSADAVIDIDDMLRCCPDLASERHDGAKVGRNALRVEKMRAVCDVERRFIERALAQGHGNISEAARLCEMERATLSKMAKKYGLSR